MFNILVSGYSRLVSWNDKYDCAVITAFRAYNNCGYDENGNLCPTDEFGNKVTETRKLTKKEKQLANRALTADLVSLGYTKLTKLLGRYPEGGREVTEVGFFVVNDKEKDSFKQDIINLGIKYRQDSVLILPKGALNPNIGGKGENESSVKGYLVGTNKCCNNWIGFKQIFTFKKKHYGFKCKFFTSFINGRPFCLGDEFDKPIREEASLIFGSASNAAVAGKIVKEYEKTLPNNWRELIK